MRTERKIIYLLAGILLGILVGTAVLGREVSAHSQNVKTAAGRLIERYPETGVLPSVGLGIFIGESGGGHNNGRYYGVMAGRRYDIVDSTDQFIDLIRYSGWYGSAYKQKDWYSQLYAIQSHGYCQSSNHYVSYIAGIVEREGFTAFDKKARAYVKKLRREREKKRRKRIQAGSFMLVFNPELAPWQIITHEGAIKAGTIRLDSDSQYAWLDIVDTVSGDDSIIYTGDLTQVQTDPVVTLSEVLEGVKG